MTKAIDFLDQIIELQKVIDISDKKTAIEEHRGSENLGESKMLFHLKCLRELLVEEDKRLGNIIAPNFDSFRG